jgi:ligand-binding SRPBCC domain-containing protein
MPVVRLEMYIAAPPERCFDLARDTTIHQQSLGHTGERLVAGPAHRLLTLGDTVTWEGRHFGVRQRLTARITRFEPPHRFTDEQVRGAFRRFIHTHEFIPEAGGTRMIDTFDYTAPLGPLGKLADALFLARYMRRLLHRRNLHLKQLAEAEE